LQAAQHRLLTQGGGLAVWREHQPDNSGECFFDNGQFDQTNYIGKNYSGASAQAIGVTVFPPTMAALVLGSFGTISGIFTATPQITINFEPRRGYRRTLPMALFGTSVVLDNTIGHHQLNSVTTWNFVC
jgi:hypothetical protein